MNHYICYVTNEKWPAKYNEVCDGINWIDGLNPSQKAEMEALSEQYRLNNHAVRDCMQPEHLPKYELVDEVHFLILRFYSHDGDTEVATIQELTNKIAIFYTEKFIITIHKAEAPFLEEIRKRFIDTKSVHQ